MIAYADKSPDHAVIRKKASNRIEQAEFLNGCVILTVLFLFKWAEICYHIDTLPEANLDWS
jgi:hypothetical protein